MVGSYRTLPFPSRISVREYAFRVNLVFVEGHNILPGTIIIASNPIVTDYLDPEISSPGEGTTDELFCLLKRNFYHL